MKAQGVLQNRRFRTFLYLLVAGLAISFALMAIPIGEPRNQLIATNVSVVIFAWMAFWSFFNVWLSIEGRDISRRIWGYFATGIFLWAIAETIWGFYEVILEVVTPYPSIADFFWVLGYVPFFLGLSLRYGSLDVILDARRRAAVLVFTGVVFFLTAYFVFSPILSEFDPARMLESLLNIFYPVGDLVLLILTSLVFFSMGTGRFALTWRLILSGFVITAVADLVFSYLSWYGLYHAVGPMNLISTFVDFAYNLSYVLFALGIFVYYILLHLQRGITLTVQHGALAESKFLIFIDSRNRIISASDNFLLLIGLGDKSLYERKPFDEVLGLDAETMDSMAQTLQEGGSVSSRPLNLANSQSPDVLCTAIALFNPQNQYDGAGIVLQAELLPEEAKAPPLTEEQKNLIESFLRRAGTDTTQDARALKAYFLEQISLIYSLVYEFNGQYVANSLLGFLAQKASDKGWEIQVQGHEISIPAEYEGQTLSASLSQLLQAGRSYGANVVSLALIDQEMGRVDSELRPEILQVIDRYGLRIRNQPVF